MTDPHLMRLPWAVIRTAAPSRAAGYLDACRAAARPEGDDAHLVVTMADYHAIRRRYNPAAATAPAPEGVRVDVLAKPRDQWPRIVRAIAKRRKPGEAGVGDTLHRLFGTLGADKLAKVYTKVTGKACGCQHRQATLNAWYPYAPAPLP